MVNELKVVNPFMARALGGLNKVLRKTEKFSKCKFSKNLLFFI